MLHGFDGGGAETVWNRGASSQQFVDNLRHLAANEGAASGGAGAAAEPPTEGEHAFLHASAATRANGAGWRAVIYFQGCTLMSSNCWNDMDR